MKLAGFPLPAVAVGLAALALYLATIAPGITNAYGGSDGGELVTAASVLGVAHGPGYGLYLLLARGALETLWFLDEPALRTNVLSALLSASAAGALVLVAHRGVRGTSWEAASVAGLALALAPVVWEQAILTEVYALHVLLTVLALLAVLRARDGAGSVRTAGLALGALAAHHPSGLFVAAPLALVVLAGRPPRRVLAEAVTLAALPMLASVGYLVARADAPVVWTRADSVSAVWHALSGAQYRSFWEWSPAAFAQTFPASMRAALLQLPPPLWPLALLGAHEAARVRPALLGAMGATALALVVVVTVYRAEGREPYLGPAAVLLALCAAWGIAPAVEAMRTRWGRSGGGAQRIAGGLLLAAVAWSAVDAVRAGRSLRGDRSAEEEPRAVLAAAPPDATVHSRADQTTFALWYLTRVRGVRPDITVIDSRGVAPVVGPGAGQPDPRP